MSKLTKCAACRTERPLSEMSTCMHAQMHYYVCDSKCMHAFYNPPKKPSYSELEKGNDALRAENERLRDDYSEACDDAMAVARKLRAAEVELAALKAVPEGVEVVAVVKHDSPLHGYTDFMKYEAWMADGLSDGWQPLMTVAQHNAIVARECLKVIQGGVDERNAIITKLRSDLDALRAENERLRDENGHLHMENSGWLGRLDRVEAENYALAEELAALRQPVADEREAFCDGHCTWLDHHPSCTALSAPAAGQTEAKHVALYEAVERACGELPDGWTIELHMERNAGWIELYDSEGNNVEDFPSNHERLDYTLIDAIDAALAAHKAGGVES